MLDKSRSYKGKKVEIFNSKFKKLNGTKAVIIDQGEDDRLNLVFELNIKHPEDPKSNLWIKETEIKVL